MKNEELGRGLPAREGDAGCQPAKKRRASRFFVLHSSFFTLERLIAVRYLFSRKQRSVVNVISWISLVGLMVSTMALIVVLSVYNGIGDVTKSLFNTFDPELVIEPAEGRTFHTSDIDMGALMRTEGVERVARIVTETAWVTYGQNQAIVKLRGVDTNYAALTGIDTLLALGEYRLTAEGTTTLVVGGQIFHDLAMRLPSAMPAAVHIPKRGTTSLGLTMDQAFNIGYAYPVGNFFIQQDIDRQYVLTDIAFVQRLMNYAPDECTSLALKLVPGADVDEVKRSLTPAPLQKRGESPAPALVVKDRHDQQPLYYKIYRTERLGIYLVLSLIVLISTLSLVASLSLLIINKRDDIFILRSMGMERRTIRRAFLAEGLLICAMAVVLGLVLGFVVCWLQQTFGIIRMGDGNFVVSAFPVSMRAVDFLATFLLVMAISTLSVALTVRRARVE
jgi:lipoprotein-releasing system permease protein